MHWISFKGWKFYSKEEKCPDPVNEFIPCFLSHDHKNIQIPSQQILWNDDPNQEVKNYSEK